MDDKLSTPITSVVFLINYLNTLIANLSISCDWVSEMDAMLCYAGVG
jgi:hypothetical protein